MTTKPSDRLNDIERRWSGMNPWMASGDQDWLIARVKRLTEVLEDLRAESFGPLDVEAKKFIGKVLHES